MDNKTNLPKYKKPPLVEVAFSVQFKEISKLKTPHIGILWEMLGKNNFPEIDDKPPLGKINTPPSIFLDTNGSFSTRVWFSNSEQSCLLQIQNDRFCYNWRKKIEEESLDNSLDYPHYEKNLDSFFSYFSIFQEFIEKNNLGSIEPNMAELTYVNQVLYNNISEVNGVFKDFNWPKTERFLSEPEGFNHFVAFNIKDNLSKARVVINSTQRPYDGKSVFGIQLSTSGQLQAIDHNEIKNWYNTSHNWIVNAFTDLVTEEAQKKWERYQ